MLHTDRYLSVWTELYTGTSVRRELTRILTRQESGKNWNEFSGRSKLPCIANFGKYEHTLSIVWWYRVTAFSSKLNRERTFPNGYAFASIVGYVQKGISSRNTNFNLVPFCSVTHRFVVPIFARLYTRKQARHFERMS